MVVISENMATDAMPACRQAYGSFTCLIPNKLTHRKVDKCVPK